MPEIPQAENITIESDLKTVYQYFNIDNEPIFKTIEINKTENKTTIYPYTVNKRTDEIRQSKIKSVEFIGWSNLNDLPADFKKTLGRTVYYGLHSKALKRILKFLNYQFKELNRLVITRNGRTRFSTKTITFKWADLEKILKRTLKELNLNNRNISYLIPNELSKITPKVIKKNRDLYYGDLESFMDRYDSFEKISESDINSLSKLIGLLPKNKISVTSNFIKTKDKINIAFLEEVLEEFKKLNAAANDIEKKWQNYFEKNSWIFSHLFPFDVILRQREAYVGGKTFENKDGKVVDFLYQNGFKDNYALLEIKTHKTELLKKTSYRGTDVFPMSDDLSGGINQCLDQKDNFIKEFGKEYKPVEPKCILVIGKKSELKAEQIKCFELLRSNQKNVDIVTFDELESKIQGLLNVIAK